MSEFELTIGFEPTEVSPGQLFAPLKLFERLYYRSIFLSLPSAQQTQEAFEILLFRPEDYVDQVDALVISEIIVSPMNSSQAKVKGEGKHDALDAATKNAKEYLRRLKEQTAGRSPQIDGSVLPSPLMTELLTNELRPLSLPLHKVTDISIDIKIDLDAYRRLRDWYRGNLHLISDSDDYSRYNEFSSIAIIALPDSQVATSADLAWVVSQVRTNLLEWGYNQADNSGNRMIDYANQISDSIISDTSIEQLGQSSFLELIHQAYRRE